MEVASVHGRPGLSHLRVEDHPDSLRVVAHGQRGAEIANQRCDDIASPGSVGRAEFRAAFESDRTGIDGLLAQRAKSFSLESRIAVTDLAAGEERLQPVIGSSSEKHASQDFVLLGWSQ